MNDKKALRDGLKSFRSGSGSLLNGLTAFPKPYCKRSFIRKGTLQTILL